MIFKYSQYFLITAAVVFSLSLNLQAQNVQPTKTDDKSSVSTGSASTAQESYKVLTEADVLKAFSEIPQTPPTNKNVFTEKHYTTAVATLRNRNAKPEHHRDSDRIFLIKKGSALMRLGGAITDGEETSPGEIRSKSGTGYTNFKIVKLESGMILSIPRDIPYQMIAEGADISFIVIRIF